MRLHDYAASGNCYKVRLLLALLDVPYERVAVFGYAHVAPEAGLAIPPRVGAWIERIRALPGFVADLAPYGENARPGAGRSIYG
jgi:glutathione S-transferase